MSPQSYPFRGASKTSRLQVKMPKSFSKLFKKSNSNEQDVEIGNQLSYHPNEGLSVESDINLVNMRKETIKYETGTDHTSVTLAGPSAGLEFGFNSNWTNPKASGFNAMAELSAARAEGTLNVTKKAALYGSANLNANTGAKVGKDGVEVNLVGFGLTMGVGGRWTVNTPLGSVGGSVTQSLVNSK